MFEKSTVSVRPAAVAGAFYPETEIELRECVAKLLKNTGEKSLQNCRAIIVPHAGYIYSGQTAAQAFAAAQLAVNNVTRIVIIGPAHFVGIQGIVAPSFTAFHSPLGDISVDRNCINSLVDEKLIEVDDRPHIPEHSLEVELPFLQFISSNCVIVPLLVGPEGSDALVRVLSRIVNEQTLVVVSTDLSHYHDYSTAQQMDEHTANAIEKMESKSINPSHACGCYALRGFLTYAKKLKLKIKRLDLRNSGDTGGEKYRVVGYGAWVVISPASN